MAYRISSRISPAFRWRMVGALPHGEMFPYDEKGLRFDTLAEAQGALRKLRSTNGAQFLIVHNPEPGEA